MAQLQDGTCRSLELTDPRVQQSVLSYAGTSAEGLFAGAPARRCGSGRITTDHQAA